MLASFNAPDDGMRLELSIDADGELSALAGSGNDRRLIGEPVELGIHWRKSFGEMPISTLGCIDGACRFRNIRYEVEREPNARLPDRKAKATSSRPASKSTSSKSTGPKHTAIKAKAKKPLHSKTR
jgi:hypothetical protein